jgi:hypothetical protein
MVLIWDIYFGVRIKPVFIQVYRGTEGCVQLFHSLKPTLHQGYDLSAAQKVFVQI